MVFVYTYTCYLVDVFFSGIITDENKSEENEISLLSLFWKKLMIKFSSSSLLTFDFCTKSVAHKREEFLTKVITNTQKRQIQNFLSLLSLSLSLLPRQQKNNSSYTL